jgi:hypothetical protein
MRFTSDALIERDILTCAILYLDGDLRKGGSVDRWWLGQVAHRKRIVAALADFRGIPVCPVCGEVYWHENEAGDIVIDGCACAPGAG